jgi:acyl carrier protein
MQQLAVSCRITSELGAIFADIFEHDAKLTPETSPETVERWDSLGHIALVRALEDSFSISLAMDEMMELQTVADIANVLRRHGV